MVIVSYTCVWNFTEIRKSMWMHLDMYEGRQNQDAEIGIAWILVFIMDVVSLVTLLCYHLFSSHFQVILIIKRFISCRWDFVTIFSYCTEFVFLSLMLQESAYLYIHLILFCFLFSMYARWLFRQNIAIFTGSSRRFTMCMACFLITVGISLSQW